MRRCVRCDADISEHRQKRFCVKCTKEKKQIYKKAYNRRVKGISDTCICVICGQEFPRHLTAKTCSLECRTSQEKIVRKRAKRKYYLKTRGKKEDVP